VLVDVLLEVVDVPNRDALERLPDLVRVGVVGGEDVEAALAEPAIGHERRPDLAGPDDDDLPLLAESEDLPQTAGELGHRVAQPALAEGPEEGQVLPDLGGRGPTPPGQLIAGDGGEPSRLEILQKPQVRRKSANCRI